MYTAVSICPLQEAQLEGELIFYILAWLLSIDGLIAMELYRCACSVLIIQIACIIGVVCAIYINRRYIRLLGLTILVIGLRANG